MAKQSKPKAGDDVLSSQNLQDDVEAFLKKGGKIEEVAIGVSGVTPQKGPKHIVISSPHKRNQ